MSSFVTNNRRPRPMRRITIVVAVLALLGFGPLAHATLAASPPPTTASPGYWHTAGSKIVDGSGAEVHVNGIAWFGFETANFAPHGLWSQSMDSLLDDVQASGFNLIRIPFSTQMFDASSAANGIDYAKNPDLKGLTPVQILDKVADGAGKRGIRIMLDRHRPDSGAQSELWYTSQYSEQRWIADWVMLAKRYAENPVIVAADIHNEPHGSATWGGDPATDWHAAAERAGNAILAANPNWLVVVEGVEKVGTDSYWWGGNLEGVKNLPVVLKVANHVVYSPHDYGPGVFGQSWFSDAAFPANMPSVWDAHWGYIEKQGIAPIMMGEFGGRSTDTTSLEGKWQNALVDYLGTNDMDWVYWCLNPNSGDTGGLLKDDWQTIDQGKLTMLKRIMNGKSAGPVIPTATSAPKPVSGTVNTPTVPPDRPPATVAMSPTPLSSTVPGQPRQPSPGNSNGSSVPAWRVAGTAAVNGDSVTIDTSFQMPSFTNGPVIVDTEVFDGNHNRVAQWSSPVTMGPGETVTKHNAWHATGATPDHYTVEAGIFPLSWTPTITWNSEVARFVR